MLCYHNTYLSLYIYILVTAGRRPSNDNDDNELDNSTEPLLSTASSETNATLADSTGIVPLFPLLIYILPPTHTKRMDTG